MLCASCDRSGHIVARLFPPRRIGLQPVTLQANTPRQLRVLSSTWAHHFYFKKVWLDPELQSYEARRARQHRSRT